VDKSNKSNKLNHIKGISKGKYSLHTNLQELEAQEEIRLEESLQDLPFQEDLQAEVERLTEQMEEEPNQARENSVKVTEEVERLTEQMEEELEEYLYE
jgi:DNA anti-recombination protein RmuC